MQARGNHVINLLTILLLIILQIAFYVLVASKQLQQNVTEKAHIATNLRKHLQQNSGNAKLHHVLDVKMAYWHQKVSKQAHADRDELMKHNRELLRKWMLPVVGGLLCVKGVYILYAIVHSRSNGYHVLGGPKKFGLCLLLLSYTTEILFFVLVVRRHIYIADSELLLATMK